ncbi:hypothetical protein BDW22DRAFT_1349509 [Trametopsis cervina]|nr:hypothetical protein BDW22DRAFT_1349509 [Trametopsis cervina]
MSFHMPGYSGHVLRLARRPAPTSPVHVQGPHWCGSHRCSQNKLKYHAVTNSSEDTIFNIQRGASSATIFRGAHHRHELRSAHVSHSLSVGGTGGVAVEGEQDKGGETRVAFQRTHQPPHPPLAACLAAQIRGRPVPTLAWFNNFGVSFSIISVITGVPSLFLYGLNTDGVDCRRMFYDARRTMVEVCSAHPTSGGPYFWAAMLSEQQNTVFASWVTGWFNLLGQVTVMTGIRRITAYEGNWCSFACATFISTLATFGTPFVPTPRTNIGVYATVLIAQGLINTFGVHILRYLNNVSVWCHAVGTTALVIAILAKAPTHQSGTFVFRTFSVTSHSRMMYAFARDSGIPGHTFFHKVDAKRKSPVRTVWLACTLSFCLGLPSLGSAVAFSAATSIATIGLYISYAIPIALRVIYARKFVRGPFHLGPFSFPVAITAVTLNYAIVAVGIVLVYCMGFWVLSARKWFTGPIKQIEAESQGVDVTNPAEVEKLESMHSFCLGLPSLGSAVAFSAATSIAMIGLYISYAIPIALRVIYARKFVRGPFHLGPFSFPVAITAVV